MKKLVTRYAAGLSIRLLYFKLLKVELKIKQWKIEYVVVMCIRQLHLLILLIAICSGTGIWVQGSRCSPNFYIGEQPIHFAPQYLHTEYPNFQANY